MAQKFLCVYHDMIPTLEKLQPAEVGRLILAALKYDANGEQPTSLPGKEDLIWPMVMAQIDRTNASYEAKCEINRRNAAKRYDRMRPDATACDGNQYNTIQEEDKTNPTQHKKESVFVPPTLEEVRAYARERNSTVDPDYFFEFFKTGNWIDSKGTPVRAWKQKFITWEKKGKDRLAEQAKKDEPDFSWIPRGGSHAGS